MTDMVMPAEASFVDLQHVSVMRGDTVVLHDVSLQIAAGECVAILGPNGCGKSTLVQTISREIYPLARPETRVCIFGRDRWDVTELRRRLGMVPSTPPVRDAMHVPAIDVVTAGFFSAARLWPNLQVTPIMREHAFAAMEQLGIADLASRELQAMSAGQQKRVMIARALCSSGDQGLSRVLLLDEPSNALDLRAQRELRQRLGSLAASGVSLLLVTHHTHDITPAFQRVLTMQNGRVVDSGTPGELLTAAALSELYQTPIRVEHRDGVYFAS